MDHPIVRVAVYVRRSLDKGLAEQTFTSLDAQEEAVRAYITSQRAHGWTAVEEAYIDRGATGSNTDREALQRLCDDVRRGRIDVVATYRLDRLSRSQRDFFELMHFFEEHGVSFVSVTEQFNTTTPMGRFALSISAAVAQLERETIAARTRDKIHATRKRGRWTGGPPPLGFDVADKRLIVNKTESVRVRRMFERYLKLGSLMELANELNARGELTKSWTMKSGQVMPGREWTKSRLHALLRNPVVIGRVRLGDETFEGEHEAIVSQELWESAQRRLTEQSPARGASRAKSTALLAGLLTCGRCGSNMGRHYASRGNRRWASYVCRRISTKGAAACRGSRAPAGELESFVVDRIRAIGRDPNVIAETVRAARELRAAREPALRDELTALRQQLRRLTGDHGNLLDAIAQCAGASARPALVAKLDEVDGRRAEARQRVAALEAELAALATTEIDENQLRTALANFDGVWAHLDTQERQRLLALLIERVTYDGAREEVAITFREGGLAEMARRVALGRTGEDG